MVRSRERPVAPHFPSLERHESFPFPCQSSQQVVPVYSSRISSRSNSFLISTMTPRDQISIMVLQNTPNIHPPYRSFKNLNQVKSFPVLIKAYNYPLKIKPKCLAVVISLCMALAFISNFIFSLSSSCSICYPQ